MLLETYGINDVVTSPLMTCIHIDVSQVFPAIAEA